MEITVEGATQAEAEQNAIQAAHSGRLPAKAWNIEDSETLSVKADKDQTERV